MWPKSVSYTQKNAISVCVMKKELMTHLKMFSEEKKLVAVIRLNNNFMTQAPKTPKTCKLVKTIPKTATNNVDSDTNVDSDDNITLV